MENKETELNKRQLFIRNLSYDTTKEELEALFQEIGPLKNISVVVDHATGKSKGFGFVKFALEDDADIALRKLQGHEIHGRRMTLEFGLKKERETKESRKRKAETLESQPLAEQPPQSAAVGEDVVHKQPAIKQKSTSSTATTEKKKEEGVAEGEEVEHIKRSRQLLVCGIPIDVNKKTFKFVLQKISRKPFTLELIKQDHVLSPSLYIINPPGKIMLITAHSRQEAQKLLDALNIGTIHNLGFAKYLNKDDSDDEKDDNEQVSSEEDPMEVLKVKHRLKERLMARLLSDMTEVAHRKRKCRLIIRNLSFQATQQNIIDKLKKFGPLVDAELPTDTVEVVAKQGKGRRRGDEASEGDKIVKERAKGFGFVTFLCEKDAKAAVESTGLKICNREVAIDFCMSKQTYLKYGKGEEDEGEDQGEDKKDEKEEEDDQDKKEEGDDDSDNDSQDNDEEEEEEAEEDDNEEGEDDEDKDEEEEGDEEDKQAEKKRRFEGDVNEGKTIFVRGLPFDATPIDVKKALGKFGKIEMALIVTDKTTGVSKGSAFVKFAESASVERCLKETINGISIKDRDCKLNLAVDKDAAERLKGEHKVGKDKRNLYLANEGLIADATQIMSEYDREKRLRAQSDKKKKLVNPLFFVSNTRISVRNIGKTVTDSELRVACIKAAKKGLERKLVNIQDMKNMFTAQGNATGEVSLTVPSFDGKHCVKSAKVMYDMGKVKEGAAQSRGYGFVEFNNHAFALACLRELNNNVEYQHLALNGGKGGRLIVEFSLENIRKVKILKERQERQQKRNEENKDNNQEEGSKKKKRENKKRKRDDKKKEKQSNNNEDKDNKEEQTKKRVKTEEKKEATSAPQAAATTTESSEKKVKVASTKIQNKKATKQAQAKKRANEKKK